MKQILALVALWFLAAALPLLAQVQVTAQTERSNFLLYERVDLMVTVINAGDSDVRLENNEGSSWLSFLVSKHNRLPVRSERQGTFAPLALKAGETKTLRVNLTPLFSFREEGDYKASAVIDLPGAGQIVSTPVPFTVQLGRKVWTQDRSVDGSQRTFSLIRFSPNADSTRLYLRVEGLAENAVYANLGLGEIASSTDPDVFFDPTGDLHVLQPISLGTYLYSRINSDGKVLHQQIFTTFREVRPRLQKVDDGNVVVAGGQAVDTNVPQERLSDSQKGSNPALPITPPKTGTP